MGGKVRYFPLGFEKKEALDLADTIRGHAMLYPIQEVLDMFQKKQFAKSKAPTPRIFEVVQILEDSRISSGMSKTTLKSYLDNLRKFARVASGKKEVSDFDLGTITDVMIRKFKTDLLKDIEDEGLIQSRKRTINSNIRQLKALFSRPSLFESFDMDFVDAIRSQEFFKGMKKLYRLPPLDLIQKTFDLWPKTDGDVHTLIGIALHFGLRRTEMLHLRRSWFDLSGDKGRINVVAELDFKPKGGHEGLTMGSKSVAKAILNKASGNDYLIEDRADKGRPAFDATLKVLREIGWKRACPLHELRKLFGSYIASTESLYISQKFLRHADASTTNDSYADAIVDDNVKNLWVA
jgi:integrase